MPTFRYLLVFTLVLIVLRRFLGVPVSIGGSLVLTLVISLVLNAFMRRKD